MGKAECSGKAISSSGTLRAERARNRHCETVTGAGPVSAEPGEKVS